MTLNATLVSMYLVLGTFDGLLTFIGKFSLRILNIIR
jgi:hypothetical protein